MESQNQFFKSLLLVSLLSFFTTIKAQDTIQSNGKTVWIYNYTQLEPLLHPTEGNDTTYVFNFWATYCAPCIKEIPHFDRLGKELSGQKMKVVLISLDFKNQIRSRLIPFIKQRNIQSRVVVLSDPDMNRWISQVSETWSGSIPATLIVKGSYREFYEKPFEYDELKLLTNKFLEK